MITRNALHGIIVLLAGLSAGYFASRCFSKVQNSLLSDTALSAYINELPAASVVSLGMLYNQNMEHFQEVLSQSSARVRETALRKQSLEADAKVSDQLIMQAERDLAILSLKDYYTQFYMHYFRWLDTGNAQSAVHYKLALGRFKATLDYTMEKHSEDPLLTPVQVENFGTFIRLAEQSERTIRWARVLVVVLIFLLVMGIPRFIRNIGYKRFSASLYFDAVFRAGLISGLNSWHSRKRLVAILLAMYLFAMVILSSFISWRIPLVFGGLGLVPLIFYTVMSYRSGRLAELLISFLAPKILIIILLLGMVALRGTNYLWYRLCMAEFFTTVLVCLLFMLIFHKLRVNTILIRKWSRRNRRGSLSLVVLALGIQVLAAGALLYITGPKEGLLALNRELVLLPASLFESPSVLLFRAMLLSVAVSALAIIFFSIRFMFYKLRPQFSGT